jgi:hypothetical protein
MFVDHRKSNVFEIFIFRAFCRSSFSSPVAASALSLSQLRHCTHVEDSEMYVISPVVCRELMDSGDACEV